MNEAAASRMAVGNPSAIKNLRVRRGASRNHLIENLIAVAETLGLEFYVGPPRDPGPGTTFQIDSEDFVAVKRCDVRASAGAGMISNEAAPIGALAFRRDWLASQSVSPTELFVIEVAGDSMQPDLTSGDLVLVDKTERVVPFKSRNVFALVDVDGSVKVKRLERLSDALLLHSDSPAYPTEVRSEADAARVTVIGRVVWSGHSWSNNSR